MIRLTDAIVLDEKQVRMMSYRWPARPDAFEDAELSIQFRDLPDGLILKDRAATSFRNNSKTPDHLTLFGGQHGFEGFWIDPTGLLLAEVKEKPTVSLMFTFGAELPATPVRTYIFEFQRSGDNAQRQYAFQVLQKIQELDSKEMRADRAIASS
jgi:hypothetical protein